MIGEEVLFADLDKARTYETYEGYLHYQEVLDAFVDISPYRDKLLDFLRRHGRASFVDLDDLPEPARAPHAENPEALVLRAEREEYLEDGLRLLVNLRDYLDTGLFLDHRITRGLLRAHAAAGGYEVVQCLTVCEDGERISSSAVRHSRSWNLR